MSENYKILIVDDEPRNVEILKVKLEAEGFTTLMAEDAESAIFAFEQNLPDMVLLDVMMPGVDGREVCKALKERCGKVFIPIILVTAMSSTDAKNEGFSAGADDYITKPVDFTELLARVRNLKRLQGMANQAREHKLEHPTYKSGSAPADEVYKVLADGMGTAERTMYRITAGGKKAYVGIEGFKIIHARTDQATGREALDDVLLWPAESYESVVMSVLKPNVDVEFGYVATWFTERLDMWRLAQEKLPLKSTRLVANVRREQEVEAPLAKIFSLFREGVTLDKAVRTSEADAIETLRMVAELFYRGLLLRDGPRDPALTFKGPPLRLTAPAPSPASTPEPMPVAAAPAPAALPADNAAELDEAKRRVEELNIEVLSLNASTDSLREENADLRMRYEGEKQRCGEISGEVAKAKQEIETLTAELAEARQETEPLRAELAKALQETEPLKAELAKALEETEPLKAELAKALQEIEALKSKGVAEGASDAVRKALVEKDKEVAALANQMIAATARNEMQASRIQELQTRIANLERQGSGAAKPPTDVLKLQSSLMQGEEEIDRLRAQLQAEAEKSAALEAKVRSLEGAGHAAPKVDALEVEALRRDLIEAERTIEKLHSELVAAKEVPVDLEEEAIDPETGLARPDDSPPEVRLLKQAVRQRDSEIVNLREQIMAAAREHESTAFMVDELNRLLEEQKRDYERRLADAMRTMNGVPD